ncbi:MAG: hypothetical protein MI919_33970, partial [Holophagales bacterium]|nr:hypothetical protein [Holophagales bacterium]
MGGRVAAGGGGRGAAVQRWDLWGAARRAGGAIASGVRAVGGAVTEAAGELLEMGRDALLAVVRRVAPDFLPLFEGDGVASFVRKLVKEGFESLFGGVLGPLRAVFRIPGLGRFAEAAGWLANVAGALARNGCSAILEAAGKVGAFFSGIFSPVMEKVRGIAGSVSGFLKSVLGALGAAVMPFLRRIGGSLWQSLKGFVADAAKLIRKVKSALGAAWEKVKGWLGIQAEDGEHEGGGLWNWVKEKATAVWDAIKGPLEPVLGPLKVVGGVLVAISPAGPILAVIRAWPHLKQAFAWVQNAWSDANLVVRGRAFFADTVIPTLLAGARRVGGALEAGASWLLGMLERVSEGISGAVGMGGILAPVGKAIGFVRDRFQALLAWAQGGLRSVASSARSLFARIEQYLGPVLEVLKRLIAIAVNPFGIPGLLLGTLWRIIPECLKGPILDFIVTVLIRVLRALPALPALGLLWPFLKAGMLGFLEKVKSFAMERKVKVANKVANIISGGSAGFAIGFLKGLALGVWDAIVGPFQALADLFRLPALIREFLQKLGLNAEEMLAEAKKMLATVSDKAVGTWERLVEGAKDLLANPGKIVEMIQSLLEAALSTVGKLGGMLAGKM